MSYKTMGVMLDMSRNAVMKVSQIKKYIDYLAAMGYNALELYTEDTFKVEGEPYFGYLRGAYTAEEIKEVDAYAASKGVELIPCIQTLAHFTHFARSLRFRNDLMDCNDILLIGEPKVYEFIEKLFKTLAENFTSRKVNIGMDEAHNVGLGKYLEQHGYRNRSEILVEHLNKVAEIATKYGFTCHMWSDMFFRLITGGKYYLTEETKNVRVSPEIAAKVPENVALTYWDYYTTDKEKYDLMFDKHREFNREVWFAGGAWAWQGFAPLNKYSLRSMRPAMESAHDKGIENVIFTVWGDDGKDCSYFSILPTLYVLRQFADGNYDMDKIKADMKEKFGWDYDTWLDLDLNDLYKDGVLEEKWNCVCKIMAFTDPFLGLRDVDYAKYDRIPFGEYAKKLSAHAKTVGEFSYIFDTLSKLCLYLEHKADLGIRTRTIYKANDKKGLKKIAKEYGETVKALDVFAAAQQDLWFRENKAFGWEVQEVRIGGIRARLLSCKQRLLEYANGKIESIEELEEELLDSDGYNFGYHLYHETFGPSNL